MINQDMLKIAMRQSAEDIGCSEEDFLQSHNVVVPFHLGSKAKICYRLPIGCYFISYGNNVVASSSDAIFDIIKAYVEQFNYIGCFETPNMYWLNQNLAPLGHTVCIMAEYFLPDLSRLKKLSCAYELRILEQSDFEDLYVPEWSDAICYERKQYDVLGIGAYDHGKLVGLAGGSTDAEEMWQIGVDVLPEYRKQGIASAVTSNLELEIIARGKVPFYCSRWSNIPSVRNAIKSGFQPAWIEMAVKPISVVEDMNNRKII